MKKAFIALALGIFLVMTVGSVYAVEVFEAKTELRQYNPDKAYNGYTLFSPFWFGNPSGVWTTYLIDMQGNLVKSWDFDTAPGFYGYFTMDGTFMRPGQDPDAADIDTYGVLTGPRSGRVQELDWDGNVLLEFTHMSEDSMMHHDYRKIWNNTLGQYTYLLLTFERMTAQDAIDNGANPDLYEAGYTNDGNGWSLDGIYETDASGNTLWSWSFADHLCQSYDPTKPNYYEDVSTAPGKLDLNYMTPVGGIRTDWTHCNSLDYNQELDQICVNAKRMSEFYVIDHGGTFVAGDPAASVANAASDAGDFMYRFGNPAAYGQGEPAAFNTEGNQQMYGSHDIQWIGGANSAFTAAELSGVGLGNFLIFDNGCWCTKGYHSESIEINGFLDAEGNNTGSYVNPPDAGYVSGTDSLSNQVAWNFRSGMENSFYSSYISGSQRLPNGNTLVCSGACGHFFEVTQDGEVVWEYINPMQGGGFGPGAGPPTAREFQTDADGGMTFSVFRAHRYGPDHPMFVGKNLTSMGPITGDTGGGGGSFRWHNYEE
jgi:hypothetical protein